MKKNFKLVQIDIERSRKDLKRRKLKIAESSDQS